ncbi:MAG: TIGR03086 family protein [Streptosporangiales bacterium]|nr:TIGR03086 family protein [Streptosporangiales bacterium]
MRNDFSRAVELDRRVYEAGLALVRRTTRADLVRPTPCAGWTLADLIEHMTAQNHGFAAAARGAGADEEVWHGGPLGDDPAATYAASVADVTTAFADADADAPFVLGDIRPDPFPAPQAVGMHLVDGVAHGWDVAKALGLPFDLDDDALAAGWQVASAVPDGEFRTAPGSPFAPAVHVDESAPALDRIVAVLGRSPAWTAG